MRGEREGCDPEPRNGAPRRSQLNLCRLLDGSAACSKAAPTGPG